MEKIDIKSTSKTPAITFDPKKGELELSGRSIPDNAKEFFGHIFDNWIDEYIKTPNPITTLNLKFDYYNTSTSLWLLKLLKKMEVIKKNGNKVIINWIYSDEDMFESGEDFKAVINININLIEEE